MCNSLYFFEIFIILSRVNKNANNLKKIILVENKPFFNIKCLLSNLSNINHVSKMVKFKVSFCMLPLTTTTTATTGNGQIAVLIAQIKI